MIGRRVFVRVRRLLPGLLTAACLNGVTARPGYPACNLIPQTEKSFESVLGATTRPFAGPGEPLELRLRPCDGTALSPNATDQVAVVIYEPTGGGPAHAAVLTAAADCSAITPLLAACEAQLGVGSDAQCIAAPNSGLQVVNRNSTNYLRFDFPDSNAVFGAALAGPATLAVVSTQPSLTSLPCQLATSSCATQTGLLACIDDFFENDGNCGRGSP